MPTLDDAPTKQVATLTGNGASGGDQPDRVHAADLVQIYDVSEGKAKTISMSELAIALSTVLDT